MKNHATFHLGTLANCLRGLVDGPTLIDMNVSQKIRLIRNAQAAIRQLKLECNISRSSEIQNTRVFLYKLSQTPFSYHIQYLDNPSFFLLFFFIFL